MKTRVLPALLGEALTSVAHELLQDKTEVSVEFKAGQPLMIGCPRVDAVRTLACQYANSFFGPVFCDRGIINVSNKWDLGQFVHIVFVLHPDAPQVVYVNDVLRAPWPESVLCMFFRFYT